MIFENDQIWLNMATQYRNIRENSRQRTENEQHAIMQTRA